MVNHKNYEHIAKIMFWRSKEQGRTFVWIADQLGIDKSAVLKIYYRELALLTWADRKQKQKEKTKNE